MTFSTEMNRGQLANRHFFAKNGADPDRADPPLLSRLGAAQTLHEQSRCWAKPSSRVVKIRQGLWIVDLRTPPGQECSNGSMLCVAVVL